MPYPYFEKEIAEFAAAEISTPSSEDPIEGEIILSEGKITPETKALVNTIPAVSKKVNLCATENCSKTATETWDDKPYCQQCSHKKYEGVVARTAHNSMRGA